jgi:hypothetical protein
MKLAHLLVAALALPLAACASDGAAQTKPGETAAQAAPKKAESENWFERILGTSDVPNAGPCPLMGVLYDAGRVVEFTGGEERFANVAYTAEMRGVRGLCRYVGTDPIVMSMEIDMAFGKGPAATAGKKTYRYWVAVTRTNMAPIEKQYFDVEVDFGRNNDRMAGAERIEKIVIPRANDSISGANFEVLVGFELTPEQLKFNRDGKRFRVDVGG